MVIAIFNPERSSRHIALYEALRAHIKPESRILDVGCGPAPLAAPIHADFPRATFLGFDGSASVIEECRRRYPWPGYTFEHSVYGGRGIPPYIAEAPRFDIMVHVGVDKADYSPVYTLHGQMLTRERYRPDVAFLECGYRPNYRGPFDAYKQVEIVYLANGYKVLERGQFKWDYEGEEKNLLRQRKWCLLGRGEATEMK